MSFASVAGSTREPAVWINETATGPYVPQTGYVKASKAYSLPAGGGFHAAGRTSPAFATLSLGRRLRHCRGDRRLRQDLFLPTLHGRVLSPSNDLRARRIPV